LSPLQTPAHDLSLFLLGSTGRMGKTLLEVLADPSLGKGFQLAGAASGRDAESLKAIDRLKRGSVVINFSNPKVAIEASSRCAQSGALLLECSTGFNDSDLRVLAKNMQGLAWALTPNTSLGVFAMAEVSKFLAKLLPAEYSFHLSESHHAAKKDAPSGTAKLLVQQMEDSGGQGRVADVNSVRGGTEVGLHRLEVLGPFESLEVEHRAQDRRLFALGALRLAKILSTCPAKSEPYSPAELWNRAD
jgi:4-hydroxy-tetrahydrodipicolinate reductase